MNSNVIVLDPEPSRDPGHWSSPVRHEPCTYLRLSLPSEPMMVLVVEEGVVVEPVFIVGMTAADSFSLSRSELSSDQYLATRKRFPT